MKNITDEQIHDAADHYVFTENDHKWSNNDDTAGDNFGSFKAGAKWMQDQQPEWISTEIAYPEIGQTILFHFHNETSIEFVDSIFLGGMSHKFYWQPIPEAPKR